MPHISTAQQVRYIAAADFNIINHSGKVDDAPTQIKHLATEMLVPGFYAININKRIVFGPYFGGDTNEVITEIFHNLLLRQLQQHEYTLVYVRSDGGAEWDNEALTATNLPTNLTQGYYVISDVGVVLCGPDFSASIVLEMAAWQLQWLVGYVADDKKHDKAVAMAANVLGPELLELVSHVALHAHEMLEYDAGLEIVKMHEWALRLEKAAYRLAEEIGGWVD